MFKFLKRLVVPEPTPVRRRRGSSARSSGEPVPGPAPLPEVTEGNEETDWSLWEDSMTALDSRMQSLGPSSNFSGKPDQPSDYQEVDAFSRVAKKDD
jgi:hypothetical protein